MKIPGLNTSIQRKSPLLFLLVTFLCLFATAGGCFQGLKREEKRAKSHFHYQLAKNYYNDRNIPMALKELHTSLEFDPENYEALHLKGFILMGRQQYDEAIYLFKEAVRLKKDFFEAVNNLGAAYMAVERYQDAIDVLLPLSQEPLYPTPYIVNGNIGWSYYMLGQTKEALKYLELSVFLNPRYCLGMRQMGQILYELKRYDEAKKYLEGAIKVCPAYAEPYFYAGMILNYEGDSKGAAQMFSKCVELAGDLQIGARCKKLSGK